MFATTLILTSLIYMLAAIVLPDVPSDQPLDLKAHYFREAPTFFGIAIAVLLWSIFREYMLEGRLPERENLIFHLLFLACAIPAALSRRERLHQLITGAMVVLFVSYIVLLFGRLH